MTDKDLRRLRRDDLLQILITQQKQIDELNAALKHSQEAQANRDLAIQESGTLAEAVMKMTGAYEAAQRAADEYVSQMQRRADSVVAEAERRADEAKKQAEAVVRNAHTEAERIVSDARREAEELKRQAVPAPAQPAPSAAETEATVGKKRGWRSWGNKG